VSGVQGDFQSGAVATSAHRRRGKTLASGTVPSRKRHMRTELRPQRRSWHYPRIADLARSAVEARLRWVIMRTVSRACAISANVISLPRLLMHRRYGTKSWFAGDDRLFHRVSASFRSNAATTARNRDPTLITGISPLFAAAYEPLRPKPK
jgi:hypothetical protein